jgi:hypothetical protein
MPSPLYNFSTGQYENGGVVWVGYEGHEQCTLDDVNAIKEYTPNVNIVIGLHVAVTQCSD